MDVRRTPYAKFLEALVKSVVELKPEKIAVTAVMADGAVMTTVYGDCGPFDLMAMAANMQADAMMDIIKANAKSIIEAAEEDDDEET